MKLTIAGPNLTTGSAFHVHKAGCRDLKSRAKGYGPTTDVDTGEYASLQEIVEEIYSDHMAENEPGSPYAVWTGYTGEFDIYPCVGELPDVVLDEPVEATEETSETSLQPDHSDATVDSSKAAPTKGRSRKAKEATKVSTKNETKGTKNDRRTWNKTQARQVVSRRNKGMSWAAIGNELGFSPRTTRSMFDSVKGEGAHYDSRLEGKGGRFRNETVTEAAERQAANAEK